MGMMTSAIRWKSAKGAGEMRSRLSRLVGSAVAAVSLTTLFAPVVLARGYDANWVYGNGICDQGELCIWRDIDNDPPFASVGLANDDDYTNDTWPNNAGNLNDSMSSAWNRLLGYHVIFYENTFTSGSSICFYGGEIDDYVGTFNDLASSHLVAVGSSC
ncbi:MAG: peptidase inhibitor family I36 protein, partial [Candidatus Limnocylindrales bacterium]